MISNYLLFARQRNCFSAAANTVNNRRQEGACIVVLLSAAVLGLLGLTGLVDLASHILRSL